MAKEELYMEINVTGLSVNIFVPESKAALEYYKKVFDAKEMETYFDGEPGENAARFSIGVYNFAMADENIKNGSKSPLTLGGVTACIQLYVDDIETIINKAVKEGGTIGAPCSKEAPIIEMPDGTRFCNMIDPFGHVWSISKK
jgi:PhnB protein